MSLKPARNIVELETQFFVNTAYAASLKGIVLVGSSGTQGSGTSLDHPNMVAERATSVSGRYPIGVLLNPVVDKDLTDSVLNSYREEIQVGNKVPLLKKGFIVTDSIVPGTANSITAGAPAYCGASGLYSSVQSGGGFNNPQVGKFLSRPDEEGYVKIEINI